MDQSLQKLPIGIQTFSKMREENYLYVDKTEIIQRLVESGSYYFLSRPRRFGKSLLLDTLKELFKGNEELFRGLHIHDKWNWSRKHPVVKISFATGNFSSTENIQKRINKIIRFNAEEHRLDTDTIIDLEDLIAALSDKYDEKVVILIDEYDKPIIDNISNQVLARTARTILRDFYGSIKDLDEYLRFVILTGVSKFSKMNLFSSLNNLEDITINADFATIAGYTQKDIETVFKEHLISVDLDKLKKWYNGYNYFGDPLYNPFDILLFIKNNCEFRNYWWNTGNPAFLIEKLKEQHFYVPDLGDLLVAEETLNAFDVEEIDIVALLWQTGYLTFDLKVEVMDQIRYKMKVPNKEIQTSLNALFLDYFTNLNGMLGRIEIATYESLRDNKPEQFILNLKSLFASIPNSNYTRNNIAEYEGYYSTVIFIFLSVLGYDIIAEDITNKGRIDLTVKTPNTTYIIEFKVDTDEPAIKQIKDRKYYEKYMSDGNSIFLLGINFSSEGKNILSYQSEKIDF